MENKKYVPKTREELKKLVKDENIYLGDIDTSYITDMSDLFVCSGRYDFSGIETWDTSNVTNMNAMFAYCYYFDEDINNWNVSKVKSMEHMFSNCTNFNQNLNSWNVSNVENMQAMFFDCEKFNQPLNKWNIKNVKDTRYIFYGCDLLDQQYIDEFINNL